MEQTICDPSSGALTEFSVKPTPTVLYRLTDIHHALSLSCRVAIKDVPDSRFLASPTRSVSRGSKRHSRASRPQDFFPPLSSRPPHPSSSVCLPTSAVQLETTNVTTTSTEGPDLSLRNSNVAPSLSPTSSQGQHSHSPESREGQSGCVDAISHSSFEGLADRDEAKDLKAQVIRSSVAAWPSRPSDLPPPLSSLSWSPQSTPRSLSREEETQENSPVDPPPLSPPHPRSLWMSVLLGQAVSICDTISIVFVKLLVRRQQFNSPHFQFFFTYALIGIVASLGGCLLSSFPRLEAWLCSTLGVQPSSRPDTTQTTQHSSSSSSSSTTTTHDLIQPPLHVSSEVTRLTLQRMRRHGRRALGLSGKRTADSYQYTSIVPFPCATPPPEVEPPSQQKDQDEQRLTQKRGGVGTEDDGDAFHETHSNNQRGLSLTRLLAAAHRGSHELPNSRSPCPLSTAGHGTEANVLSADREAGVVVVPNQQSAAINILTSPEAGAICNTVFAPDTSRCNSWLSTASATTTSTTATVTQNQQQNLLIFDGDAPSTLSYSDSHRLQSFDEKVASALKASPVVTLVEIHHTGLGGPQDDDEGVDISRISTDSPSSRLSRVISSPPPTVVSALSSAESTPRSMPSPHHSNSSGDGGRSGVGSLNSCHDTSGAGRPFSSSGISEYSHKVAAGMEGSGVIQRENVGQGDLCLVCSDSRCCELRRCWLPQRNPASLTAIDAAVEGRGTMTALQSRSSDEDSFAATLRAVPINGYQSGVLAVETLDVAAVSQLSPLKLGDDSACLLGVADVVEGQFGQILRPADLLPQANYPGAVCRFSSNNASDLKETGSLECDAIPAGGDADAICFELKEMLTPSSQRSNVQAPLWRSSSSFLLSPRRHPDQLELSDYSATQSCRIEVKETEDERLALLPFPLSAGVANRGGTAGCFMQGRQDFLSQHPGLLAHRPWRALRSDASSSVATDRSPSTRLDVPNDFSLSVAGGPPDEQKRFFSKAAEEADATSAGLGSSETPQMDMSEPTLEPASRSWSIYTKLGQLLAVGAPGFFILLSLLDLQGGAFCVVAFRYASLSSASIIDCISLLTAFVLSVKFLGEGRTPSRVMAVIVGILGSLCILASDYSSVLPLDNGQGASSVHLLQSSTPTPLSIVPRIDLDNYIYDTLYQNSTLGHQQYDTASVYKTSIPQSAVDVGRRGPLRIGLPAQTLLLEGPSFDYNDDKLGSPTQEAGLLKTINDFADPHTAGFQTHSDPPVKEDGRLAPLSLAEDASRSLLTRPSATNDPLDPDRLHDAVWARDLIGLPPADFLAPVRVSSHNGAHTPPSETPLGIRLRRSGDDHVDNSYASSVLWGGLKYGASCPAVGTLDGSIMSSTGNTQPIIADLTQQSVINTWRNKQQMFGDLMCILAAMLLGSGSVMMELGLAKGVPAASMLSKVGFIGSLFALLQWFVFDASLEAINEVWCLDWVSWLYFSVAVASLACAYLLCPLVLMRDGSSFFNLSLMTSAALSVLFSAALFGDRFPWLYCVGLCAIVGSLVLYHKDQK